MLDRPHRLTSSAGFSTVTRRGRRVGGSTVVLHYLSGGSEAGGPQVGFVVSRAVGAAVTRNRVRRRLRHLMRDRLDILGPGSTLVVRAMPAAGSASSVVLSRDLDAGLRRLGPTATRSR